MKLTNHEGLHASGWLGLLLIELCLMGLGMLVHAQAFSTTTVQGTVYLANGQPGTGTLVVSWPSFTTASGQVVAADSTTVAIAPDGFVSVNLAANQGATPAGLYYTAIFYMSDGSVNTQYWVVPAAASATLGQVQAQLMPAAQAVQAASKAYVDQAVAALTGSLLTASGATMTGPLTLCCDPTTPLQAADKHYVDEQTAQAVPLTGGTLSGPLTATRLGALYQVDQFAGADFGAQLGACLSGLSSTQGGTCDARNFSGTLGMGSNLTISTANATVLLPCATISTANQIVVTAGTRNVSLRGCALRGASTTSGSQGGTVFYYSGTGAMVQVGDSTYAADTLGFHLDNAVINITAAMSASAQGFAAYRTQELDLESLYFLGNAYQTGMTLDGTGNYTGGTFYDNEFTGFQTAVNAIGHQIANPATTDWVNASTFVRLHIDCPTSGGNPISGTYGINLQQGDGNTFTGGDVEGCATALHLGANAQNNTIVGLRNENSTNQVVADAGSSYNSWMTGGTMFSGQLTDNGTRNSFLDTFHRSFNGLNGDWYGSQKDATVTNHWRLGTGAGNERGLLNEIQTDYGYRWMEGYSDATAGEQFYQIQDLLNNVNRVSIGQYNNGQSSTNNQTVINAAGTGAVVLNGSNNSGTGGVVIGSGGASETTVATISNAGNAQFNGTLQVGGTSTLAGTPTVKNQADAEIDATLWAGLTSSQKESFIYKDWNGNSQWYMVKDANNNWALNSATGGLDSFKAYQSTNSGDTYIDASNSTGVVRINYETGSGTQFKVYGGNSGSLYAAFTGTTTIQFPGLAASSGQNCLQIDNSGYVTNTGSACGTGSGSGSGTVNSGTSGQIAYYNGTGTALSGTGTVSVTAGGTGSSTANGALANLGGVATSTTVNGHALSGNVTVSATDLTTGTLPHAQLPTLLSGDIPSNAANTTGTAASFTGSLAGDVTGTQSATSVGKINGGSVPASASVLSSNSSSQLAASTSHNLSVPANCVAASGSGTAYTCTTSPTFTPATGDHIQFKADVANTGSATLAVNGATAATFKKWGGAGSLIANDLLSGHWISATFDGTYWQLEGQLGNANATELNGTAISGLSGSGSTLALTTSPTIASPTFTGTVSGVTATMVGLGNVTNNAQTQAAIVPNTAPSSGQDLVGNAGGTAYAPVTMSGDCTRTSTGAITCTKSSGTAFATGAFAAIANYAPTASPTFTGTVSGVTATMVGLGNVTNNAQTQAAIVPNTAPSSGQDLVGNAGGTAYAPVTMSGDCTRTSTGAITCTKSSGTAFGTGAFATIANYAPTASPTFTGTVTAPTFTPTANGITDWYDTTASCKANRGIINILDCGADATGTNDSTAAINAAISASQPDDEIFFPTGTYKYSGLTIPQSKLLLKMHGNGNTNSVLNYTGTGTSIISSNPSGVSNSTMLRLQIFDLGFFNAGGGSSAIAINMSGTYESIIERCRFTQFYKDVVGTTTVGYATYGLRLLFDEFSDNGSATQPLDTAIELGPGNDGTSGLNTGHITIIAPVFWGARRPVHLNYASEVTVEAADAENSCAGFQVDYANDSAFLNNYIDSTTTKQPAAGCGSYTDGLRYTISSGSGNLISSLTCNGCGGNSNPNIITPGTTTILDPQAGNNVLTGNLSLNPYGNFYLANNQSIYVNTASTVSFSSTSYSTTAGVSTTFTISNSFSAGQWVYFSSLTGPTYLNTGTPWYISAASGTSFTVAALASSGTGTTGGSATVNPYSNYKALTITSSGALVFGDSTALPYVYFYGTAHTFSGVLNAMNGIDINGYLVLPSTLTGYHGGASDVKVQMSDGTGTSAHLAAFDTNGGLTDAGVLGASLSSATSIAATSFTSTGLALAAIPVSTTKRGMCVLIWEQNTAVGTVQFGMGMNNAPTDLWVINLDTPGAYKAPTYTTITSTTTTAVSAADAPSATATGYRDEILFTLVTGSSNAVTVTVYGLSSSTSDALVIEPGSYCTWLP